MFREREASAEHRQPLEHGLFRLGQEVVAPLHRSAESAVATVPTPRPISAAASFKMIEVIERDELAANARAMGERFGGHFA